MAAFGVPLAHEDDAERAVRAALAIVAEVEALGLAVRIGVESGEVVVDDARVDLRDRRGREPRGSPPAGGAAGRDPARARRQAARGRRGRGRERRARRDQGPGGAGLDVARAARARSAPPPSRAPFVGREAELELLENSLARAVRDRRAQLVTVFGEPGLGKTRLVERVRRRRSSASTTLSGRTLPYGEGVTYWPLASMIKAQRRDQRRRPARTTPSRSCASAARARRSPTCSPSRSASSARPRASARAGELTWAALRWAEQLADGQPLVLVFEDVHWAEEPLLELIEHLARVAAQRAGADRRRRAARPARHAAVLGRRQSARERDRARAARPSTRATSSSTRCWRDAEVPPAQRALVLEQAEGNPLFLEEIARCSSTTRARRSSGSPTPCRR